MLPLPPPRAAGGDQCHFIRSPASMTIALKRPSFHPGRETLLQQRAASTDPRPPPPPPCVPRVPTYLWHNASCCGPQLIDINKDGCFVIPSYAVAPVRPGIWVLVRHLQIHWSQVVYRHIFSVMCPITSSQTTSNLN